jgi:hypothetical protein
LKNYTNYLLVLCCILLSFFLIKERKTFWDAIPYMGAVLAFDENDPKIIHEKTYKLLKENTAAEEQKKLIDDHPFCKAISQNNNYFLQQLPFFQVKFLYVFCSYIAYKLGVPLYDALFFIVIFSSVLILIIIYNWLKIYYRNAIALLLSIIIILCWFNLRSFTISSPDALAGLFFIIAIYQYLEKNNLILCYVFLFLATLTRPDYIFFVTCFYMVSIKQKPTWQITLIALLSIFSVILLSSIYRYNGWQMFYRSFVDLTVSPQTTAGDFSTNLYLNGLYNGLKLSMSHKSTYLFFLSLIFPFFFLKKLSKSEKIILYTIFSSALIKFFIHPWLEERFVFIFIDIFMIVFLKHIDFQTRFNKNFMNLKKLIS